MSKHLRVLKDAGLVEVRADAQRRLYRIRPEPLAELDDVARPLPRAVEHAASTGSNSTWTRRRNA